MPKADSINPLFHRIYSVYFKTVRKIINKAFANEEQSGSISRKEIDKIIKDEAFKVSHMEISNNLHQLWKLFTLNDSQTYHTELGNVTRPQTTLEKQWLYTIAADQRSRLFNVTLPNNKKIHPLYNPDMLVMYDKFQDGDNYHDQTYIQNFRSILSAIKEERYLEFEYFSNKTHTFIKATSVIPLKLEYSPKNDKFRLLAITNNSFGIYNLKNIQDQCQIQEKIPKKILQTAKNCEPTKNTAVIEITNDRNALQRALLAFSDYKKSVVYIGQRDELDIYKMELEYLPSDETELLIRILTIGHLVKVIASKELLHQVKQRIQAQAKLFHKAQYL